MTGGTAGSVNTGLSSSFAGILNFNANGQEVGRAAGDRWVNWFCRPSRKTVYLSIYASENKR